MPQLPPGFENLITNIQNTVAERASNSASQLANQFTGTNIDGIQTALLTAKVAEEQVKAELLEHIKVSAAAEGASPTLEKDYYTTINTRKKDAILEDLQQKFDRQMSIVTDTRDLYQALSGSENVDASDYYILKNNDIEEQLKDISGLELTNKRKALYNLDYVKNMEKIKDGVYTIYIIMTLIYIVFFIRAKKYKSNLEIIILICMILYPFLIYHVMKYIVGILDYIFSLTPVNAYRNMYDNDINMSTSRDNDINVHYSKVRDE